MELTPFSVLNQYLRERLIHPDRYSGKNHSFLKIFQHGLSFAVNRFDNKLIKNYLYLPYFMQRLVYALKGMKGGAPKHTHRFKKYVILDPGRVVKGDDDQWHSIYFDRIREELGPEHVSWITTRKSPGFECDFFIGDFDRSLPSPNEEELAMLREMNDVLYMANKDEQYSDYEMKHLRSAMHIFFEEFRFYYHLFKNQHVEAFIFICHYHSEGMIAAAKALGIKTVEVQHGLIATNDLYYVYHEQYSGVIQRAFFPDQIMVYGPYWKRILGMGCEFRTHQVTVAGDYLYRLKDLERQHIQKENMVLICAQKNLHVDYVNYGKKLAEHLKKHPDWHAVMKLHPLEKNKEAYQELKQYGIEIVDVEIPLDRLLKQCKIQISIYSTTFYDALGYNVVNYSLQDYGNMSDYASDMISEGVAAPIMADQDPIAKFLDQERGGMTFLPREDVYAPFDATVFHRAVMSKG